MGKINVYDKIMIENQKKWKSAKFVHKSISKRFVHKYSSQHAKTS